MYYFHRCCQLYQCGAPVRLLLAAAPCGEKQQCRPEPFSLQVQQMRHRTARLARIRVTTDRLTLDRLDSPPKLSLDFFQLIPDGILYLFQCFTRLHGYVVTGPLARGNRDYTSHGDIDVVQYVSSAHGSRGPVGETLHMAPE